MIIMVIVGILLSCHNKMQFIYEKLRVYKYLHMYIVACNFALCHMSILY